MIPTSMTEILIIYSMSSWKEKARGGGAKVTGARFLSSEVQGWDLTSDSGRFCDLCPVL